MTSNSLKTFKVINQNNFFSNLKYVEMYFYITCESFAIFALDSNNNKYNGKKNRGQ